MYLGINGGIGDFQSPLYTKAGSGETDFRYPKDKVNCPAGAREDALGYAAQGG